ncbi:DUF397 domain-containing protein [Nocardiopsis sediminis]|uniref:DUF397 domain-containing protein n=1 Tax=Nocardiopsis sediminis TaxID=1778267 RepID=A0ABV8FVF5_9ACTN
MIKNESWRKSSYSVGESNCVEVADTADKGRAVRDTQNRDAATLPVGSREWVAFLADIDAL